MVLIALVLTVLSAASTASAVRDHSSRDAFMAVLLGGCMIVLVGWQVCSRLRDIAADLKSLKNRR